MAIEAAAPPHPLTLVSPQASTTWRRWTAVLCGIFGLHLILAFALPEQGWITCVGVASAYAVALTLAVRRALSSTGIVRVKWAMLAAAFGIRICRDFAILYGAYVLRFEPDRAWIHSALAVLPGVPLLFVLSSTDDDDEPRAYAWLDSAQLLLIAGLFLFDLFPGLDRSSAQAGFAISIGDYLHLRTIEFLCLALLAAVRTYAAVHVKMRSFYANLLFFVLLTQCVNLFNDYMSERTTQGGSPAFALTDLPPLVFVFLSVTGMQFLAPPRPSLQRTRIASMIRLGSPAFFALAVLLLSVQVMNGPARVGVITSCAGLVIYGTRSAFLQMRYQQTQSSLISAQSELLVRSQRDPLTGLYNRRWFDDIHRSEWSLAQRAGHSIALLIIDIDHFKEFNDNAGHKAGDQCLQAVASILSRKLQRDSDSISRYGGEEFAVILPITDAPGALIVAERLRAAVESLAYSHPVNMRGVVTVSIGAASIVPTPSSAPDELFLLADAALYRAKQNGRNQVALA